MTSKRLIVALSAVTLAVLSIGYAVAQERSSSNPRGHERRATDSQKVMATDAAFPRKQAEHMDMMIKLIQRMKQVCFDPETVGVMAVGALKDEVRRKDEDIIKDLEEQLAKVKALGLRNAIRLTLKDLYKRQGKNEKVLEQLKALIAENDKALQAKPAGSSK